MSSLLHEIAAGVAPPPPSLTTAEFERQCVTGAFPPDWNVELLDGMLILCDRRDEAGEINTVGPQHSYFTRRLDELLSPLAAATGCCYRAQMGTSLPPDDAPQPDGLIAKGATADYRDRNPAAADVLLTIEVAQSSLEHDRTTKLQTYAQAGLSPYWILNVAARTLEVRTDPDPAAGSYRTLVTLTAADTATLPLPGGDVSLPLADLLG
ncbi:Uma2 family endonuclease [Alienimonas chondri]|uniref:Putative restriction endonuclease domain-containing protein n=1 Tax=Alienimonas chondri TaxID=2681879 RepID=A0ABX1VIV9_9PLAN|nr:Uma2 family endonuclease [Alienimonas chondri]NNJ27470.1 hypothetical protein [Alienimonas chondri]